MDDLPYSNKALHFISLSLKVHIDLLEERLRALRAEDEDRHEDEIADLLNDSHYLKCLLEETEKKIERMVASLGTGQTAEPQ